MKDGDFIESIKKMHEEEIKAEIHESRMRRLPDEILGELESISLHADLLCQKQEDIISSLHRINANIYELHNTQKDIRSYAKFSSLCLIALALTAIKVFWL